jgi:O-antigen ligase
MLLLLLGIFILLVFTAAGTLPGVVPLVAVILAVCLLLSKFRPSAEQRPVYILTLAVSAYLCAMLLPLPAPLTGPVRWADFRATKDILSPFFLLRGEVSPTVLPRLSMSVAGTIRGLFLVIAAFALFWLVVQMPPRSRRQMLIGLVIASALLAAAGIIGRTWYPQDRKLLWLLPIPHGRSMGPFVNRNHFALFCALVAPPALALTVEPRLGVRVVRGIFVESEADRGGPGGARWPGALFLRLLFGVCFGLVITAVFVSESRGAVLALLAGIGVTAMFHVKARAGVATAAVVLAILVILGILFWPSASVRERFSTLRHATQTPSGQTRLQLWHDATRIWRDYPVAGCGIESFRAVYPRYKSSTVRKSALHSENEYVQLLAETGLIGVSLALTLAIFMIRTGWWTYRDSRQQALLAQFPAAKRARPRPPSTVVPLPFFRITPGVCAVFMTNWMFDFGMRMPLNAFTAMALVALVMPVASPLGPKDASEGQPAGRPARDKRWQWIAIAATLTVVVLAVGFHRTAWEMDKDHYLDGANAEKLARAVRWAPTYWLPWYELGRYAMSQAGEARNAGQQARAEAWAECGRKAMYRAVECSPNDYRIWRALAYTEKALGNQTEAEKAAAKVIELRSYKRTEMMELIKQ